VNSININASFLFIETDAWFLSTISYRLSSLQLVTTANNSHYCALVLRWVGISWAPYLLSIMCFKLDLLAPCLFGEVFFEKLLEVCVNVV
jgi:hypothetical protein